MQEGFEQNTTYHYLSRMDYAKHSMSSLLGLCFSSKIIFIIFDDNTCLINTEDVVLRYFMLRIAVKCSQYLGKLSDFISYSILKSSMDLITKDVV